MGRTPGRVWKPHQSGSVTTEDCPPIAEIQESVAYIIDLKRSVAERQCGLFHDARKHSTGLAS